MRGPEDHKLLARQPVVSPRRVWSRRAAAAWISYQWPIVIALWLAFMALGYLGFSIYYQEHPLEAPHALGDLAYYTIQLVPMESGAPAHEVPWQLAVARHVLPLIATYAIVAGLIVVFAAQVRRLRLSWMREHVVICGLGRSGAYLARRFRALGYRTVAIDSEPGNASTEACLDEGILVVSGGADDLATLRRAGTARAAYLIAVDEDDSANVGALVGAGRLCGHRARRPLTCIVSIAGIRASMSSCAQSKSKPARGWAFDSMSSTFWMWLLVNCWTSTRYPHTGHQGS